MMRRIHLPDNGTPRSHKHFHPALFCKQAALDDCEVIMKIWQTTDADGFTKPRNENSFQYKPNSIITLQHGNIKNTNRDCKIFTLVSLFLLMLLFKSNLEKQTQNHRDLLCFPTRTINKPNNLERFPQSVFIRRSEFSRFLIYL